MTDSYTEPRLKQLVDWSSAVWAGLLAGTVFLLMNLFLTPLAIGGNAWMVVRLFASILLGESILAPPSTFDAGALAAALLVHFTLSILFACLVAFCLHRWGLVVGTVGGAVFGLALYCINFYTLTLPDLFPWFFAMRSWAFVVTHLIFGGLVGFLYEALEVEEFVSADEASPQGSTS